MSLMRVLEIRQIYERDAIFLIEGGLHRHGPDLVENCRYFLQLVEQL